MEKTKEVSAAFVPPHNAVTGIAYQGMNINALLSRNFTSSKFATFLQWRNLGYHVRKGEHGTYCRTFGTLEKADTHGKKDAKTFFKAFVLFNETQVEKTEAPVL